MNRRSQKVQIFWDTGVQFKNKSNYINIRQNFTENENEKNGRCYWTE
jgi:hypothetical protein